MVQLVCKPQPEQENCQEEGTVPEDDPCSLGVATDCDGNRFSFKEIHFHTGSDHTVGGRRYDMEVQVIGYPETGSAYTEKMVLSLLGYMSPEATNDFISPLNLMDLPSLSTPVTVVHPSDPSSLDLQKLFQGNHILSYSSEFSYYSYRGSLTRPQCQESVRWVIAAQPFPIALTTL